MTEGEPADPAAAIAQRVVARAAEKMHAARRELAELERDCRKLMHLTRSGYIEWNPFRLAHPDLAPAIARALKKGEEVAIHAEPESGRPARENG